MDLRRLAATGGLAWLALWAGTVSAAERVHYIAAEETVWDYAPLGRDNMSGEAFSPPQQVFVGRAPGLIGRRYVKAVYRAYDDAGFTRPKARPAAWRHLGILGPVIHAEVGDTIRVVFRNKASRPYSVHPHGVFYGKDAEGAPYADGTSGADKADDAVSPGGEHSYLWRVPERAGPGPNDPDSIGWLYHSHFSSVNDTNAGLVGAIIVTARGRARPDGTPRGVDREFITLFKVFDENKSWYLDANIARFTEAGRADRESEAFAESNLMHAINGMVYANLPGLEMKRGERVRWYTFALGTEVDLHTPHWHGNTGLAAGRRVDVITLLPASAEVVDMRPDDPGLWMFHCHVDDHITAGMTALYRVR